MKMKTLAALFFLSLGTSAFAQKGVEDGSKYGHGADSLNCLKNLSIYSEYVKTGNYKDAYLPWKAAFTECPLAQLKTYTNGVKIIKWFLENEKDPAKYKTYFNELMSVYDQRIKYFGTYDKAPAATVLGMKAMDYLQFGKTETDLNKAYQWFEESVSAMKETSEFYTLMYFMDMSAQKFKTDPNHKEKFIQDYMNASGYVDAAMKACTNPQDAEQYKVAKNNIDAHFINSGAADCAMLQSIYAPKVEENKTNIEYLKKVVSLMELLKCTDQEAYFNASLYAHKIEPTSETAVGCAFMAYKKENIDEAVQFIDQALELEKDNLKKAEYAYKAAAFLASAKKLSQARAYAQKAISLNGNYGAPYILIAQLYATSPRWSEEPALNSCTYFLILDKLQRAKSVDPSVAEEANKLINSYAGHTPSADKLFFLNLKKGDSVTIGGWIGESTVIR